MSKKGIVALVLVGLMAALTIMPVIGAGPVVIRYTRWASADEAKTFQVLVDKFNATHPTVKVETEFLPWDAYWSKMTTNIVSGEAADLLSMSHMQSNAYMNLGGGAFLDLSKQPGIKTRLTQLYPGATACAMVGGKPLGLAVGVGVITLFYNKDLFDAAGLPYPDVKKPMTFDQFFAICKKLTKVDASGKPLQYAIDPASSELMFAMIYQAGAKLADKYISPTKMLINSADGIRALTNYKKFWDEKVIVPNDQQWDGPWGTPDNAVASGKVGFNYGGPWNLPEIISRGTHFGTCPLFIDKARANTGYFNFLSIYKGSKHIKEAWTFLEWVTSKEGQIEFAKTGDLPANKLALEACMANPPYPTEYMQAFYNELPYVFPVPQGVTAEWGTLIDNVRNELTKGTITPAQAAKQMQTEGQKILDKDNKRK